MIDTDPVSEAHGLVAAVRAAAALHRTSWEALVPDEFRIDLAAEMAEDAAYSDMAEAKADLRRHICATYGISIRELSSLAMPRALARRQRNTGIGIEPKGSCVPVDRCRRPDRRHERHPG